ncbi:MAG: hypothetical protein CUN54_02950 [Phototrophicales bacterium]|nr:MAG: hypothetical protein CUN54_02950 [Phototrophicales bacterium]
MTEFFSHLNWIQGYSERSAGEVPNTYSALYRLSALMTTGHINPGEGRGVLLDNGLADISWKLTWREDHETPDEHLIERLGDVDGYVIFMHGWTGNHRVWEELPALLALENPRLVSISVDHNGFGNTRFVDETPNLDNCNPPAAMRSLERWLSLLHLRSRQGDRPKVINFVGHSMGGAALFYLNPLNWRLGEETRYAIAPALLLQDELHSVFFTALGTSINILQYIGFFKFIERVIKPELIDILCAGASDYVKKLHSTEYEVTPRGITGATLVAMGLLHDHEIPRRWDTFRVILGHKDRMVGLSPMMDLLSDMEFPTANIRVVPGSHYLFSIGKDVVFQHAQNRELVVQDILALHERALDIQKHGVLIG